MDLNDAIINSIVECTFLTEEQIIGSNSIYIFKEIGLECFASDFARANIFPEAEDSEAMKNHPDNEFYGEYALADIKQNKNNDGVYIAKAGSKGVYEPYFYGSNNIFIRPVLKLKSIIPILELIKKKGNLLELEFGHYPRIISSDQDVLKKYREKRLLSKIDLDYLYEHKKLPIYKYKSDYLVETKTSGFLQEFSNGLISKTFDGEYWFKVQPIKWYVDLENKLLISKELLTTNTDHTSFSENKNCKKFEDTKLYHYLNNTFLKELFQLNKIIDKKKTYIYGDLDEETDTQYISFIINQVNSDEIFNMDYGDEINAKVRKIIELCKILPEEARNTIYNKTKVILEEYRKNTDYVQPSSNRKINLTNYITDTKKINPSFTIKLDKVIMLIAPLEKYSTQKQELSKYKKLLKSSVSGINLNSNIFAKINNILYYSSKLNDNQKSNIIKKLTEYINDYEQSMQNYMNHFITDEIELELNYDYQNIFIENINKLYEECLKMIKDIAPITRLKDILSSKKETWEEGNSLSNFLNSIKYLISKISTKRYHDRFQEEYQEIINKYLSIIQNSINNNDYDENFCKKIENNLRVDLNKLLQNILKNSKEIDLNNINRFNDKLLEQISNSISILEGILPVQKKDDIDYQVIASKVLEIDNKYFKSSYIDIDNAKLNNYKESIKNILKDYNNYYKENEITTLEEYNQAIHEILHNITTIEVDNIRNYLEEYKGCNTAGISIK